MFDNVVRVYDKNMRLLAIFDGEGEALEDKYIRNMMISPTVRLESNGVSTLKFEMLPTSEKWLQIRDPENIYVLNDRYYTALSENAYKYEDRNSVQVVVVTLHERWALLDRQYNQAYNCGIYTYAKARFTGYTNDGATFTINAADCSNPGNTISSTMAWEQVKAWTPQDDNGNKQTYYILSSDEFKATGWENVPSGVFLRSINVSGNTATITIESRAKRTAAHTFPYSGSSYKLDVSPTPSSVESVTVNYTIVTPDGQYTTAEKTVPFTYASSTGTVTLNYSPAQSEKVNGVLVTYGYSDLGTISPGATCTFAYGAEAIDEHTFVILPKAKAKYKLVIDGVAYEDSQVKDARGVVMPRGSGGYAMWAALKNSGWTLGVCDVIATGFDASIDYGCFNVESDMQDVLYNIQYIQELYGGILDWDSQHKVLNYRAENSTDYQAYNDDFNRWRGYEFREGKNMTERPVITVDNKIITKAYLLGYGNLNVKKVNGGRSYIENHSFSSDTYEGYLKQELIYDTNDEGGQRQLLYWGEKELAKQCRPRKSITLSVTDIRTVEGHEHEIFDINNIVRAYYHDDETGENKYEEQRVIVWEYNAFAMWDCTVELGDKTRNMTELFRLVYNKTLQSPGVNASGSISSSNVTMGGAWDGGEYYGDENSLTHYIELIARTTTDNSDAIAGLILDTSETHAKVDLFSFYQKQTDELFTEAYAGLTLYTDEKSAEVLLEANKYTEKTAEDLEGNVTKTITETRSYLEQYADDTSASAALGAETRSKTYAKQEVDTLSQAFATFETNTERSIATLQSNYQSVSNNISTVSSSVVQLRNDMNSSFASLSSTYVAQNNLSWAVSQAGFATQSDINSAMSQMSATYATKNEVPSVAQIQTIASDTVAQVNITAKINNEGSGIYLSQYQVNISAAQLSLSSGSELNVPGNFMYKGYIGMWMTQTIGGQTITYLGHY